VEKIPENHLRICLAKETKTASLYKMFQIVLYKILPKCFLGAKLKVSLFFNLSAHPSWLKIYFLFFLYTAYDSDLTKYHFLVALILKTESKARSDP